MQVLANPEFLAGILLGVCWSCVLFALYIERHLR